MEQGKSIIFFKRLTPTAKAPMKAHDGDAGWDICADRVEALAGTQGIICHSGLALAIPDGMWPDLRARSSVYRMGLFLSNGVGTIDSGYRGEVMACFYGTGPATKFYGKGDRFAQLVPMPCRTCDVEFVEVDSLEDSADGRGNGGFGSSGA